MTILPHEKQVYEYEEALAKLKEQSLEGEVWPKDEIEALENKLGDLKEKIYSGLKPWDRVQICRHPGRPQTSDYIEHIFPDFEEISGDRGFADDAAIIMGCAHLENSKFFVIGQEKGKDTESRLKRNFGMPHPEGYRKALRGMKLAEKFNIPIVCFLDTPGAYPGLAAEERGQGWAIAKNLLEMAQLKVPVIVIVIGEGCSGGALGIGVGDTIGMLEHAYYSVISPEGCASILWKNPTKNSVAAAALKLHAEDLIKHGIIDKIIKEPLGGAHHDPEEAFTNIKRFILESLPDLALLSPAKLIENRYEKFRKMGAFEVVEPEPEVLPEAEMPSEEESSE